MHPTRREIFAGKSDFTFYNIWDLIISNYTMAGACALVCGDSGIVPWFVGDSGIVPWFVGIVGLCLGSWGLCSSQPPSSGGLPAHSHPPPPLPRRLSQPPEALRSPQRPSANHHPPASGPRNQASHLLLPINAKKSQTHKMRVWLLWHIRPPSKTLVAKTQLVP